MGLLRLAALVLALLTLPTAVFDLGLSLSVITQSVLAQLTHEHLLWSDAATALAATPPSLAVACFRAISAAHTATAHLLSTPTTQSVITYLAP